MVQTQIPGAADHVTSVIAYSVSTTAAYHSWVSDPSSKPVERKLGRSVVPTGYKPSALKLFNSAKPDATHLDTGFRLSVHALRDGQGR